MTSTRIIIAACAVALAAGVALAHGGATGIVKERMDAMGVMKETGKGLAAIVRGQAPFESAAAAALAAEIEAHSGESMTKLFPEGSLKDPSEALPEIWTDWSRFEDLAMRLEDQAASMRAAAEAGDEAAFKQGIVDLTATCSACHKAFREEK